MAGTWTSNNWLFKPPSGPSYDSSFGTGFDRVDARLAREVWVGDSGFATFGAAITAIGATDKTVLRIPVGTHTLTAAVTVTPNIMLKPDIGAVIELGNFNLAINGPYDAGRYKTFSYTGTGVVTFGTGSVKEVYAEWWGAVGDGTTDCYAAFTAALNTGRILRVPYGTYKIIGNLYLVEGGIIGSGWGTANDAQKTSLVFYNCTTTTLGAITTRQNLTKNGFVGLENLYIKASSWDGATGCLGYGIDAEAPMKVKNVYVQGFKKSNIWIHGDAAITGQPSQSTWENVMSTFSGEHGCLVGGLGQNQTFINYQGKWNGAPDFETAPTSGTHAEFDGFHIDGTADGIAGYPTNVPEGLVIIGGDCSYNGRYGWYFKQVTNSSLICPSYAEGNLINQVSLAGTTTNGLQTITMADTTGLSAGMYVYASAGFTTAAFAEKRILAVNTNVSILVDSAADASGATTISTRVQAAIGVVSKCSINFADLNPGQVAIVAPYASYSPSLQLWAGGRALNYSTGGDYSLSQKIYSYLASDGTNAAYIYPNNAAAKVTYAVYGKGHQSFGTGGSGAIESGSNFIGLPTVIYRFIQGASNITAITNNGTLVRITTDDWYVTGDRIYISGVAGQPLINGKFWWVTRIEAGVFDLAEDSAGNPSVYAAGYVSGGTAQLCVRRVFGTAAPATRSMAGDYCERMPMVVGQPKGWACTVSATPGTWVADANL